MCGFIGKIGPAAPELLNRGLPWISRRGPDSQRLWASADGRAGILFARLAIVDADPRAHQPLTDADSGVTVGMVGEIYNYQELKTRFPDYRFRSQSDTELILAAYAAHGSEGFAMLKGMFVFVLVDERRRKVFLVRDPVGKKPLFLAQWGGNLYFGSSLLPLVAASGCDAEVNTDELAHYWRHTFVFPGNAALRGARPVLPGERIELDWNGAITGEGRCEAKPEILYSGEPLEKISSNVGALLGKAVSRRLKNNPNPMILLSGGIDSTVISESALDLCRTNRDVPSPKALTLGSLIPLTYDERYARYAARRLEIPMRILRPALGRIHDTVVSSLDLQDEPLGMPSYYLLERLTAVAARYGRVLLSGEGGDEIFLGYGRPGDWRKNGGQSAGNNGPLVPCAGPLPEWMSSWARHETTNTLLGHMLAKADRATAEQGVELRCPLLDWDVVRYARSLPYDALVHGGRTKSLLKDQLSRWPHWFIERPKAGFTYNLRWLWGLTGYAGLREHIDPRAVEAFLPFASLELRARADRWKAPDIFRRFDEAWKILAWSRFLARLDEAARIGRQKVVEPKRNK